jgi:hypothetical protein
MCRDAQAQNMRECEEASRQKQVHGSESLECCASIVLLLPPCGKIGITCVSRSLLVDSKSYPKTSITGCSLGPLCEEHFPSGTLCFVRLSLIPTSTACATKLATSKTRPAQGNKWKGGESDHIVKCGMHKGITHAARPKEGNETEDECRPVHFFPQHDDSAELKTAKSI